jgi:uncharacterized protein involved in type VI secretion and phage assembly
MSGDKRFYGVYRATVTDNDDPLKIGRIQVIVPDVSNVIPTSWAMPCVPIAGKQMGIFVVPQVGAGVWVQFEQGDPDFPVWTGGFWGSAAEAPAAAASGAAGDPNIVIQSALGHAIVVSDLAGPTGGIMLRSTGGATILVNDTGIFIKTGKGASVVLTDATVTINDGALAVS